MINSNIQYIKYKTNRKFVIRYNVDVVLCIDCTMHMDFFIGKLKDNIKNLYNDALNHFGKRGKVIEQMRVRVICFRDFYAEEENALYASNFFKLPEQNDDLEKFIGSITTYGGGDEAEDGLEALACAIKSDWNTEGMKKRHVIAVFSDGPTHEIGYGSSSPYYPKEMPEDFDELSSWWGSGTGKGFMNDVAKRLLLYAPDEPDWGRISRNWDNVIHFVLDPITRFEQFNYDEFRLGFLNSMI